MNRPPPAPSQREGEKLFSRGEWSLSANSPRPPKFKGHAACPLMLQ